jgi:hypothetical protein
MRKITLLICLLLFSSCSNNISQNAVNTTTREFSGGVYRDIHWNDPLIFERTSWYQELTMVFDVMFHRLAKDSKFRQWFSNEELKEIEGCKDFIVSLHYFYDSKRISDRMFKDEMNLNQYEEIVLNQFARNIKLHPDYIKWRLQKHKIMGFCKKELTGDPIVINFPGFKEVRIDLGVK